MDKTRDSFDGGFDAYPGALTKDKPFMTANEYKSLLPYLVPIGALLETESFLRSAGDRGCEGAVLWIGEREGDSLLRVKRVIAPRQTASRWHFEVPLDERIRVATALGEKEVVLLQVHSHPEEAFHSPTDDRKAMVDRQWALSVVVPNFCRGGLRDLGEAAVYSLRGPLDWVQLTPEQVRTLFIIE